MPLTKYIDARVSEIRAFLEDPDAVILELRAANEQIPALAKLVIGIGEHEDGEDVMVGADGAFDAGDELCAALDEALREAAQQIAKAFELRSVPLRLPEPPPPAPPHPDPVAEHRVAEHAERLADALAPYVRNLVLVIKPVLEGDGTALALQLARLGEALESGRVKLVLISDERQPLVRQAVLRRPRRRVYGDEAVAAGARDEVLRALMADPLARVIAYDAPSRGQRFMQGQLPQLAIDGRTWLSQVGALRWFDQPMAFYGQGLRQVLEQLHPWAEQQGRGARSQPLLEAARVPRGEREAERHFVQRLYEYVDAVLEPHERLVVLVCPVVEDGAPPGEWASFAESVRRLTRALVTPRVKLVVVAPGVPGPDEAAATRAVRAHRFRIDDQAVEQGLRDKLQQPGITPLERLRCTSTLAGFAMARGNPEEGMELSLQALDQAHDMDDPNEIGVAWYGLGNALYRCAAFDQAIDAYARALDLAVDQDSAVLAAQAVTGMGNGHFVLGQTDRAIECYGIGRTYYQKLGNRLMEAYVLTWLGESHAKAQRPPQAEEAYLAAVACCDEAERTLGEAARSSKSDVLQRMARFHAALGQQARSQQHLEQARALGPVAPLADEP